VKPDLTPSVIYTKEGIVIQIYKGDMQVERVPITLEGAMLTLRELTVAIHRAFMEQQRLRTTELTDAGNP
jgi:hypothetical protein